MTHAVENLAACGGDENRALIKYVRIKPIFYTLYLNSSSYIYNMQDNMTKTSKKPKTENVQINIAIPLEWKRELENLARIYSVEEGKTLSFLELMRRGIQEKYHLGELNLEDDEQDA